MVARDNVLTILGVLSDKVFQYHINLLVSLALHKLGAVIKVYSIFQDVSISASWFQYCSSVWLLAAGIHLHFLDSCAWH